jgi:predicted TIM-barrel fold metal-dependent hydrolase
MNEKTLVVAISSTLIVMCHIAFGQGQAERVFDHHTHVLSPRLVADWKSLGREFARSSEFYTDSSLIVERNEVDGAFLISMAHLYSTDEFQTICKTEETERRLVAAENDFVAVSVARMPRRFIGFFSINLFRKYAFDELSRCKANPNLTGLKLHLPSCGFNLEDEGHWKRLSEILSWAAREDVPVLLHLTAGEAVDLTKALWFWESIVEPHSGLELYVAHLGSVGGFNDSSKNILMGYHLRTRKSPELKEMAIYFDLSGAIIGAHPEIPRTTDQQCKQLSELMLRIGVEHFLFASDYPVFSVSETRSNLANRLALPADELAKLLSNRSRLFDSEAKSINGGEQTDEREPE